MTGLLDEILDKLNNSTPDGQKELEKLGLEATKGMYIIPNIGRQTEAYHCKADILLYGGSAGGGKSILLNALALSEHKKSVIYRRHYPDLKSLYEECLTFYGKRDGFSASPRPILKIDDNRSITYGAVQYLDDIHKFQGQAYDFIGFDEGCQFLKRQFEFLINWNRTASEGQRCRVVIASNPPMSREGEWLIEYFAAWLDPNHPNPADYGELRWYGVNPVTEESEELVDYSGSGTYCFDGGEEFEPISRTFIPASVEDNPYLMNTNYKSRLDGLTGKMRSAMRDGVFATDANDVIGQLIPNSWITEAQNRWTQRHPNIKMTCVGTDAAGSGADATTIVGRYDGWFSEIVSLNNKKGEDELRGSEVAAEVFKIRHNNCAVVVDMGGGYGGRVHEILTENNVEVVKYNGAAAGVGKTKDKSMGFVNMRAKSYWRFREALDPEQDGGSPIMLPPDRELAAELAAITYEVKSKGIQICDKKKIRELLGRSPDKADSVIMAYSHSYNSYMLKDYNILTKNKKNVNIGDSRKLRR